MEYLGLITARGGSKSIRHKNITPLAGRPLLAYTCDAALGSRRLTRVALDTDDPQIANVGKGCGLQAPYMRPQELAGDDTLHVDVLRHAVAWFAENEDYRPDALVLLQPTSPLRRAEHIDGAIDVYERSEADSVVSVTEVPHQFSPVSVMRMNSQGSLLPLSGETGVLRRQDKQLLYARNGPAVLISGRRIIEAGQLYGPTVKPYVMTHGDSVDIDDVEDIALAEFWLARRSTSSGVGR